MSGEGDQSGQEKSFDPTPSRLDRARREGDVPLSREINAFAAYTGLYVFVIAGSGAASIEIASALSRMYYSPEEFISPLIGLSQKSLYGLALEIGIPTAIALGAPMICVLLALFAQQGFAFAPSKLAPKWSRLSLIDNATKKFGPQGLSEFAISAVKLVGVLALFGFVFFSSFKNLPGTARLPAVALAPALQSVAVLLIGAIVSFSLIVGAVDLLRVRFEHKKRLMMSLEEVRRESKETEGDPHFKQSRRDRAKAIATNRMLHDIPKANVVIVNPTHYAVALKWDGPKSGAPHCVAKGVDEMAAKIRQLAAESGVPIRRDAPTARAIYSTVEIGEQIRREHYAAVAAAIHFAEKLRKEAR
jgi:flagellar biosynthetic protein FlhB